jgi:epoxyqueuosine reductase
LGEAFKDGNRQGKSLDFAKHELSEQICAFGRTLGFDLIGVSSSLTPARFGAYERWLATGMAGEMSHLQENVSRRQDLGMLLDSARSVIVVGANYSAPQIPEEIRRDPSRGVIASYAGGEDYHPWMLSRLEKLAERITQFDPGLRFRAYADTGPVMERDFAAQAGLGFIGKNALLIHPQQGSFFFLGVLIVNLELPTTQSPIPISCGTCTRCLEACPTGALVAPYTLDARRCISYLTIEKKGRIPHELRPLIGNRIFGCDECQLVCPWNQKFARPTTIPAFETSPEELAPKLTSLASISDEEFKKRFAGSVMLRTKRRGLLRNVAVALGNCGVDDALEPLKILIEDGEPLVRAHAAWALGRLGKMGRQMLEKRRPHETNDEVQREMEMVLRGD